MRIHFILCLLLSIWFAGAEEECRVMARFREENHPNGTTTKVRNYDKVEIFWSNADDFVITKRLGSGTYGEAYLGHNIHTLQKYVVKIYRFGKLKRKKMMREILVTQSMCGHPNIIRLEHVIRQSLTEYPALVFEYAKDTYYRDLYPALSPEDVRFYMHEIFQGLAFAHDRGVMHKDLKPANIMIDHANKKLKIIDWGLSQFYVQKEAQSISGSLYYKSPEMLLRYDFADYSTDIWSLGCVFAALLFRTPIYFTAETPTEQILLIAQTLGTDELLAYTRKYSLDFNSSLIQERAPKMPWERMVTVASKDFATAEALDLLNHMLVYDPAKRITAKDAIQHPYFRALRAATPVSPPETTASSLRSNGAGSGSLIANAKLPQPDPRSVPIHLRGNV